MHNLILPSNVKCKELYPNNKPADYTTKLFEPIIAGEGYEACLTEIQYPATWANVKEELETIYWTSAVDDSDDFLPKNKVTITPGYYHTNDQLAENVVTAVNRHIDRRSKSDARIEYNFNVYEQMSVLRAHGTFVIFIEPKESGILRYLGFKPLSTREEFMAYNEGLKPIARIQSAFQLMVDSCLKYDKNMFIISQDNSLDGPLISKVIPTNAMYVYTDIVEQSYLGDSLAPILGIVPVYDHKYGNTTQYTFPYPQPIRLNTDRIDTIHIHLADEFGQPFNFRAGTVIVKIKIQRSSALL
jgi:hypothetical protein